MTDSSGAVWRRAGRLLITPYDALENASVLIRDGVIVEARQGPPPVGSKVIDHGPGALMPALVNAHTHLELSCLKGKTKPGVGMTAWVRSLLQARAEIEPEEARAGLHEAIPKVRSQGAGLIGDVCNQRETALALAKADFHSWSFLEFLGGSPPAETDGLKGLSFEDGPFAHGVSLAGHAPHTTTGEALREAKQIAAGLNLPFSLHLAESPDEVEFIRSGGGPWRDLLDERGLEISFKPRGMSPVAYVDSLGILDSGTLAVHLTRADRDDLALLAQKGARVCVCPRSNLNITGALPPLPDMLRAGLKPALGTDSLSSVSSLSLWDEMAFIAGAYPDLSPADILAMATINGAKALGCESFSGQLTRGARAVMVYAPITANSVDGLLNELVYTGASHAMKPIGESN